MTIIPVIALDENDFAPFVQQLEKKTGEKNLVITDISAKRSVVNGQWLVNIETMPATSTTKE